jgi:hypothetical protein
MFAIQRLAVRPVLAGVPVDLPLQVMLAFGEHRDVYGFNLPAASALLLGRFNWERAVRVLSPHVWAPGWNEERFRAYLQRPVLGERWPFGDELAESLRAPGFLPSPFRGFREGPSLRLDIVQIEVTVTPIELSTEPYNEPYLDLSPGATHRYDDFLTGRAFRAGAFRDALVGAQTRLLIYHSWPNSNSNRLAELIVGAGGPAVITVTGTDRDALDLFFLDLYAGILHNRPLTEAARPRSDVDKSLDVRLFFGEEGENLLRFDGLLVRLSNRIENQLRTLSGSREDLNNRRDYRQRFLHRSQWDALHAHFRSGEARIDEAEHQITEPLRRLREIQEGTWQDVREGVVALSELAEQIRSLQSSLSELTDSLYQRLNRQLLEEVEAVKSPRVLNANFRSAGEPHPARVLRPLQALRAGEEYDLLVDVGPRWNSIPSLVTGKESLLVILLRGSVSSKLVIDISFPLYSTVATIHLVAPFYSTETPDVSPGEAEEW